MPQGKPAGARPHYEAQKISTVVAGAGLEVREFTVARVRKSPGISTARSPNRVTQPWHRAGA